LGSSDKVVENINHPVILFDGVCNLCNAAVRFVIKRDKRNRFLFASLQSSFGQQQLSKERLNSVELQTIVLLKENKVFLQSDAALEIARHLSGIWPAFYLLKIFPRFIRDAVYNFISRNRYNFFGKTESCMIPDPKLRAKFIE
jgi:predicted DCC family thiol-disulfide oxidoreductase YuxK